MPITYRRTPIRRLVNNIVRLMIRWNIGPSGRHLLIFKGYKSGKLFSTPVTLVQQQNQSWLVAPYGEVPWVKNVRAAGSVIFERGGRQTPYRIQELPPKDCGQILKAYLALEPVTQPFFNTHPDSPVEEFAGEASNHPVFALSRL